MYIDKFKEGDFYCDESGTYYEDAKHFISTGVLGFCDCGDPDASLDHIRMALQLIKLKSEKLHEGVITKEQWEVLTDGVFKDDGHKFFMWYFLHREGLTEHGSSVPGWLSEKGEMLLNDLTELFKKIDRD